MNQRSSLIVFCFASALVGGIIATQSSGRDRATAQPIAQTAEQPSAIFANCVRCPWQYKFAVGPGGTAIEVAPVGTSGVLHAVLNSNTNVDVWEGAAFTGQRVLRVVSSQPAPSIDLQFTNGLFIVLGTNGEATVLYKLDMPLSTGPEK